VIGQCEFIGLERSSYTYEPAAESPLNLELMRVIDEQYTMTPFYGWPRMSAHMSRRGHAIINLLAKFCHLGYFFQAWKNVRLASDCRSSRP
jgi:hypothetical protein